MTNIKSEDLAIQVVMTRQVAEYFEQWLGTRRLELSRMSDDFQREDDLPVYCILLMSYERDTEDE